MTSKLETSVNKPQQAHNASGNDLGSKENSIYNPHEHNANVQQELWIQKQVIILFIFIILII
jgi:hypothetical protein